MPERKELGGVWIVTHVEYAGCTTHPHLDRMVFHVASTRRAALAWIRKIHVEPGTWWELLAFEPDCVDRERDETNAMTVVHVDARGNVVRAPNRTVARATFAARRARELASRILTRDDDRCAFCRRATKRKRRA
ncbi:MAG: hypothetical protein IPJ77_10035 [Planctomycetes bacterium]|nr:hypothetical protein [Planctomycetota bacterium]